MTHDITPGLCGSYYGSFRTRTFAQIFPSFENFKSEYTSSNLAIPFTPDYDTNDKNAEGGLTLAQFYYMMYAHYGNSHIAYTDEHQFKYYMYTLMYQYGPTVIRKREIRYKLFNLSFDELVSGGKAIYNHAFNPNTAPSTSTIEELLTINDQNTTNYKKGMVNGLTEFLNIISDDPVDKFIHRFRQLFIKVLAPDYPLLYETEE